MKANFTTGYLPSGSLVHKIIISGERVNEHRSKDGYAEDNTKAFREMVASGELIKAVTVKGNDGKPKTDESSGLEYIEADEVDYSIAYGLMIKVLSRKYSPLNQQSRDLFNKIMERIGTDTEFTQKDCEQWCGLSNTTIRRRLWPLESAGIITVNKDNKPYRYKVEHPELADVADLSLPLPEDIAERIAIMSE